MGFWVLEGSRVVLVTVSVAVMKQPDKGNLREGGFRGQSIVRDAKAVGHIVSVVWKQRAVATFTQLIFSFLCLPGPKCRVVPSSFRVNLVAPLT